MANGNSHDRLAEKIEAIEQRIEDRSVRRDAADAETREVLVSLDARMGATEKAITAIQAVKPPSAITLWGPAITTIGMVAALLWLVMTLRVDPVAEKAQKIEEVRVQVAVLQNDRRWLEKIQDDVRVRLRSVEDELTKHRVLTEGDE